MRIDRRRFLTTTAAASLALGTGLASGATRVIARPRSRVSVVQDGSSPDALVVGAGTFGLWTALHLQRLGARVTVVDAYGAGNSRQTSGGETRGVRTSYGDRPHGRLWTQWATKAIQKWTEWDEMGRERLLPRVFFNTGDLILRARSEPYIQDTRGHWDALGSPYEVLTADEVAYRWPWIRFDDLEVALYEPAAGVVRARRAIESVARVFEEEGGTIALGRVSLGDRSGATLVNVTVAAEARLQRVPSSSRAVRGSQRCFRSSCRTGSGSRSGMSSTSVCPPATPEPPPNVPTLEEKNEDGRALTMREAMVRHRANPTCAACHSTMDPIGFALENFDAVGGFRVEFESMPIDASGSMPDGSQFDGPAGLRGLLLDRSDLFVGTLTQKLMTYALGRGLKYYDMPKVRQIVRDAATDDYQWSSIILGIIRSDSFRMRRSD